MIQIHPIVVWNTSLSMDTKKTRGMGREHMTSVTSFILMRCGTINVMSATVESMLHWHSSPQSLLFLGFQICNVVCRINLGAPSALVVILSLVRHYVLKMSYKSRSKVSAPTLNCLHICLLHLVHVGLASKFLEVLTPGITPLR